MFEKARDFFTYNHKERKGIITISFLVLLIIFALTAYRHWAPEEKFDFSRIEALSDSLEARKKRSYSGSEKINDDNTKPGVAWKKPDQPFSFDPNTLNDSGWMELGFNQKNIETLRNYMNAGAEFRSKRDFEKLYFVNDSIYNYLEPYIALPESNFKKWDNNDWDKDYQTEKIKWSDTADYEAFLYEKVLVDLNTADTTELDAINWIGPYYAREISKYRDELGGFYNKAQLLEIWSFTPGKIDTISEYITIDISQIKKIPINKATAQELSDHPYLSLKVANSIVNCRIKNGEFKSMDDLAKCNLVNAEIRRKIAAYLNFN